MLLFSCSFCYLFLVYPRKILVLLLIECIFLYSFFNFFYLSLVSSNGFIFSSFVMILFLVLDSVVGVSLMLSIGRVYGPHSCWFF